MAQGVDSPAGQPARDVSWARRCLNATAEWILKPVAHAVLALIALGVLSPWLLVGVSRVNPSCASHPGFTAVDMATRLREGRATVTPAGPEEAPGVDTEIEDGAERQMPNGEARWLFDRRLTSSWSWSVPDLKGRGIGPSLEAATQEDIDGLATLHVTSDLQNIQLVCVVNGAPLDPASYVRADRAEVVEVRTSCSDRPVSTTLRSQPDSDIYAAQRLPTRCRDFGQFTLTIRSTYPGQYIDEPSTGRPVGPTHLGALAEMTFYTPVNANHPEYSKVAAAINWLYTHPVWLMYGAVALGLAALLAVTTGLIREKRHAENVS